MIRKNLRLTGTVLFALLILLPTARPLLSAADIRGEFSFSATVDKIETDGETVVAISGKVLDLPVRILLNGDTLVQYASGSSLEPAAIPAGSIIQVKAEWTPDGFLAKAISLGDASQVTVTGSVGDVSAGRIVVGNLEFKLGDQILADAIPKLGQVVIVQGRYTSSGALVAASIESQSLLRIFGKIEGINAADQTLLISSKTVYVTDKTVIQGIGKTKLSFTDLAVGELAEVGGDLMGGKFVAQTIVVADPKKVTVSGVVTAYEEGKSISVKVALETVQISISGTTEIHGTPAVGVTVQIEASLQKDGALLALSITVKGSSNSSKRVAAVQGTISQIGQEGNLWFTVAGTKVTVDAQTVIKSKGQTKTFANLQVGDTVLVLGSRQSDGSILARTIELMSKIVQRTHVEGKIQSIGNSSLVVNGITVVINDQTNIKSKGSAIALTDLKVGFRIDVEGTKQPDGSILALSIEVMGK